MHADGQSATAGAAQPRGWVRRVSWPRVLAVVALVALTAVAANSCQRSQIRVDQARAIATARSAVDFQPRAEQIRLVRQGLTSRPFWAVSLSVPAARGGFAQLAVVKIDANTGRVASVAALRPGSGG